MVSQGFLQKLRERMQLMPALFLSAEEPEKQQIDTAPGSTADCRQKKRRCLIKEVSAQGSCCSAADSGQKNRKQWSKQSQRLPQDAAEIPQNQKQQEQIAGAGGNAGAGNTEGRPGDQYQIAD